jgi:NAD(P)H-dependent flavin oxidoreductase YrpB (nitropropane dioxygenase family)
MDIIDRLRLDVPVGQAGMGGGLAGAQLAGAVAKAGGLGTLGLMSPGQLRASIDQVRAEAPDRAVAVNLLMPFVRRNHVAVCVDARVDVVVVVSAAIAASSSSYARRGFSSSSWSVPKHKRTRQSAGALTV